MARPLCLVLLGACGFSGPASGPADAPADQPIDAGPAPVTVFVADFAAPRVHRYVMSPDGTASAPLSFTVQGALSPFVRDGELLVGELGTSAIARFTTPLATPTPAGTITGNGISNNLGKMVAVDDELWIVNVGAGNVLRLAFDPAGAPTMVGSFPVVNPRGIAFDRIRRDLYVTQCCGTNTILHYIVAADHTMAPQASFVGAPLSNPHGIVITPWGEVLVANAGDGTVRRFARDPLGNLTGSGAIQDNGLGTAIDMVYLPWDELLVTSSNGATAISRFSFDATHTATPRGTLPVPDAMQVVWMAQE